MLGPSNQLYSSQIAALVDQMLNNPRTFLDEFSRPIGYIREYMKKTGYDFWYKYPSYIPPKPSTPKHLEEAMTDEDAREHIKMLIPQGIFEENDSLNGAESTNKLDSTKLKESYNFVTYIGRNPESPTDKIGITFAKLGENFPLKSMPVDGDPPATPEELINELGFTLVNVEGYRSSNNDTFYESYKGRNDTYGNEIWVTFYNDGE